MPCITKLHSSPHKTTGSFNACLLIGIFGLVVLCEIKSLDDTVLPMAKEASRIPKISHLHSIRPLLDSAQDNKSAGWAN